MRIFNILSTFSVWMGILLVAGLCSQPVMSQDDDVEDVVDGEDEASVETDETTGSEDAIPSDLTGTESEGKEDEENKLKPSPDAETHLLFIQPKSTEFPAGKLVKFIVGFRNKGSKDFIVDSMDAAFRYPQDFSYYIQNFTASWYRQTVEPFYDATFQYAFIPSESFSARPFGLTINLNYHDADGNIFQDAVFNSTINVIETDEGFDGETFFLYVFLLAGLALLGFGAHQLFNTYGKKRLLSSRPRPVVELGTQNNKGDVDYEWLPDSLLSDINRTSPKSSPKASTTPPRQRKARTEGN